MSHKSRYFQSVIVGLIMVSAVEASPSQPLKTCASGELENGFFQAYSDPKPISQHAFTGDGGKAIRLDKLPGPRALLVNFWTTWCTPCRLEMPSMDRLQARVPRDRLLILPLVRDGNGLSEAVRFYRTYGIVNLPVAADRFGKISHDHHIGALPQTLFVDQQGSVIGKLTGGVDWESAPVLELLDDCLGVAIDRATSG